MSSVKDKTIQLSGLLNGWFGVSLCTEHWTQSNEGFCKLVLTESTNISSLIKAGQYPLALQNFKKTKRCVVSFCFWNVFQPRSSLFVKSDRWRWSLFMLAHTAARLFRNLKIKRYIKWSAITDAQIG